MSLVPSNVSFRIPLRFSEHAELESSSVSMVCSSWLLACLDGPGLLSRGLCMVIVWLSGVVNLMRLALWLAGWLDAVYRKANSWLSLGSLWLLTSSWLCLDRCLVIGGVVLFIELVFCGFFFRLLEGWGSSVASCGSSCLVLFVLDRLISLARTIHSKYKTLNRFRPFRSSSAGQNAQCRKIMAT